MIVRPYYLNILKTYRNVPLVKILAGIRRCGKSTILDMLKDDLIGSGIQADHVIHLRYTSEELDEGMTAKQIESTKSSALIRYLALANMRSWRCSRPSPIPSRASSIITSPVRSRRRTLMIISPNARHFLFMTPA